jgi:hypothetical protein
VQPFRPSLRDLIPRLTLLAAASWMLLRVAFQLDVRVATVMTAGALGVTLAVRLVWREPHTRVVATPDALRIESPDGARTIPWGAIERVRLAAGEVSAAGGTTLRVCYAHVDITDGAPVAFADLSSLGAPRFRTVEGDAPVYDVGDPELLLGVIAEHVNASEFLPPDDPRAQEPTRVPWLVPSALATVRLGVAALLVHRVLSVTGDDVDTAIAAFAALAAIGAPHALVRFFAQRDGSGVQSEVGAPPAVAVGALVALALAFPLRELVTMRVGAWALAVALVCAMPSWPLPGAYVAKRLGRRFAGAPDTLVALGVGALGVCIAWLYAKGMVFLPTVLVGGGLEAAEGFAASRRHARLAELPRFARWSPEALARWRAVLRPLEPGEFEAGVGAGDIVELRNASLTPPPPSLVPVVITLVGVLVTALAVRFMLHAGDADATRALRWLLS